MSFRGDILTIGTGMGSILFYDLRASKYMTLRDSYNESVFKTSAGWVVSVYTALKMDNGLSSVAPSDGEKKQSKNLST